MFFDIILLRRQNRGRLGTAWVAGTLGITHVETKRINSVNIVALCNDIASYLTSHSASPRERLSLRLSAILTNGVVRIYGKQVTLFLCDLLKIWDTVRIPPIRNVQIRQGQISARKSIRRRRQKPADQETPEDELPKFTVQSTIRDRDASDANVEDRADQDILTTTMRDTVIGGKTFRRLSDLLEEEEEIATLTEVQQLPIVVEQLTSSPVLGKQRPEILSASLLKRTSPIMKEKQRKKIDSSTDDEDEQRSHEVIVVAAQVHATADREPFNVIDVADIQPAILAVDQPMEIVEQPMETVEKRSVVPRRPLKELQIPITIGKRPARPRKKALQLNVNAHLIVNLRLKKDVRINKKTIDIENINKRCNIFPVSRPKLTSQSLTELLNQYLIRREDDGVTRRGPSTISVENSEIAAEKLNHLRRTDGLGSREYKLPQEYMESVQENVLDLPIPTIELQSMDMSIDLPQSTERRKRTHSSIEKVLADSYVVSPRKIQRLNPVEPQFTVSKEHLLSAELSSRDEVVLPEILPQEYNTASIEIPFVSDKVRQQNVVDKLLSYEQTRFSLEDFCEKPLNKLRIARTFMDLLVLCKAGYVVLVSEEDSNALKYVEKGPKLA